jgi:phage terminase large subunit-like protein
LACQRQLDDLKNQKIYRFDYEQAEKICNFVELLPHIKGKWAGTPIKLEPWQKFKLTTAFGWVHKKTGLRRFRIVYLEEPRKQAKSTISSAVALYMLAVDGEGGAECYSAATTRDQARIVFQDAQEMARRSRGFRNRFGVQVHAHSITQPATASKFMALSADSSSLDGLNVHLAIIDELHAHKSRKVFDVISSARGSRTQPLLWCITTAGSNRAGICYEQRTYLTKLLEHIAVDDTFFGCIWSLDDGDDWTDPKIWAKANPNYNVSVYPEALASECLRAQTMASAQNEFLTKYLNVWVSADVAWMDMMAWDRCRNESMKLEEFEGKRIYVALDLASRVDIAAMNIFVPGDDGHLYTFGKYFLPEDIANESTNAQYSGWARMGKLTLTPGNTIDFAYIEEDLRELSTRFEIVEVPYDPFQATQFSQRMLNEGFPMVEMRPTVLNFSEPMKHLDALVREGKITHDGCPILTWMISNVEAHLDLKDNIFPRKAASRAENKIDGVIALIMNVGRYMANETLLADPYRERGLRFL